MGKYGEEGDQLLFKVLNSGDFLKDVDQTKLEARNSKLIAFDISEKGLRYDLTVPFARYVVMNRHEITLPFKRYQIQPVWRADRPQKGRYREFYQCDADVVGTNSLICEAEIILMIKEAFKGLGIEDYTIKTNHRGILSGLAELCGTKENETSLFVAIDKLDKIGEEKVKEELISRGFPESSLTTLFEILNFKGTTQQKIEFLSQKFSSTPSGQKGVADFNEVLNILSGYGVSEDRVEFDIALARGLSYYTGCIFEVKINNVAIGSVSGGGRYDNLTQAFGAKEQLSGVGISFGIDRIYDAMEELKLFPQEAQISTQVLVAHFDEESKHYGLKVLQTLRDNGISSEIYPDSVKIQKQLDFANKKMVPYSIVIGSEEMKSGLLAIKNMKTGEQFKLTIDDILKQMKGNGQ
jgi:histidyl-tRNA synthetase